MFVNGFLQDRERLATTVNSCGAPDIRARVLPDPIKQLPQHAWYQTFMKPIVSRIVARSSMLSQILPQLRQDVVEGRWKPGERLIEPVLCEQFGVSRTPMRDALRVLESEGLVELIPHVGAVVTKPEAVDIAGTFDILAVLEASAAEKAALARSPAFIARLRKLVEKMHDAVRADQSALYLKLNDEFHRRIVLESGNPALIDIHEHLMWHVHRIRHSTYSKLPFSKETGQQHDDIVAMIERGDAARVFAEMRAHMMTVGHNVMAASGLQAGTQRSAEVA
jgi:DNA-binding GntR family transcriptional regulator